MSLLENLKRTVSFFEGKKVNEPALSAERIFSHVLGVKRLDLYLHRERVLREQEIAAIEQLVQKRALHVPLAYLFQEVYFYDAVIRVSSDVLIPRDETERLVDLVSLHIKSSSSQILWDLCTGSGCIAIALKKKNLLLKVVATDISESALQKAKENALFNRVAIDFYLGDLGAAYLGKWDILVSNPPYISEEDYQQLPEEVRSFEPQSALVGGKTGLEFYERIARIPFSKGQKIFLEIGEEQAEAVEAIFYRHLKIRGTVLKDYQQKKRFFFLEIE